MKEAADHTKSPADKLYVPVLIIGIIVSLALSATAAFAMWQSARSEAQHEGESMLYKLDNALFECEGVTNTMSESIHIDYGAVRDFQSMAKGLLKYHSKLSLVAFAPDGNMQYVYPEDVLTDQSLDLMTDERTDERSKESTTSGKRFIAGPYQKNDGGSAVLVCDPIMMEGRDQTAFWGFAVAAEDLDTLMEDADFASFQRNGRKAAFSITVGDEETFLIGKKPITSALATMEMGGMHWNVYVSYGLSIMSWMQAVALLMGGLLLTFVVSGMVQANRTLAQTSRTDALTKIPNRRGFDEALDQITMAKDRKRVVLVAADIDRFKIFNDMYGHDNGDVLLKSFAKELTEFVGDKGYVARNGGDEFQIFLTEPSKKTMQAMQDFFDRPHAYTYEGKEYQYRISGGYATYPDQTQDMYELYRKADAALYHAKASIDGRLCQYDESMPTNTRKQISLSLQDFSEGMPGPFIICRANGHKNVLFTNALALQLFDYPTQEAFTQSTGGQLAPLFHPDDRAWLERTIQSQQGDPSGQHLLCRIRTGSGAVKRIALYCQQIHHDYFGDIMFLWMMDVQDMLRFRSNPDDKGNTQLMNAAGANGQTRADGKPTPRGQA